MILPVFASLLIAAQPMPTTGNGTGGNGQPQPVTTEDPADAAQEAAEEAGEAVEEAAEEAGETAEEAAEASGEAAEDDEEGRVCRRRNFYDDYGRRRSRKVCHPR